MNEPATRTCDACGRQYTFTDFQHDRCPYCCPKLETEPDAYELDDWGSGDNTAEESG